MWGRADAGQLGVDQDFLSTDSIGKVCLQPFHLTYFSKQNRKIKQIALGEAHSLVLDEFGTVYSFGWSELG
jgi:alpha-tubulin suppressor-like RCC1 family protein